uniref:Alpha-amylase n=1 Tax=Habrobracon hebetor TaxID=69819 RepID=A0A455LAU3_9HYME|nr:alpha amylase [Habrobracon hebetor]
MGYAGVQVSPVQENVIIPARPWWERYQPISYKFISRSGSEEEFKDMVRRCNAAGVRIYVDALLNHMAADHPFPVIGMGNSTAHPEKRDYPAVPYTPVDFHPSCEILNYQDAYQVRNCELVGLHDLNQTHEHVRNQIVEFLNHAIDAGVAGFRIDAAKHMWPEDLKVIYSRLHDLPTSHGFKPNSRPYVYQEVIDMGGEGVTKYEYNSFGAVTEFKYGIELTRAMTGNNPLKWYRNIGEEWELLPRDSALVFIDNHDNQRGHGGAGSVLTHKQPKEYKMALAFMLAHPYGNAKVMSSFAFNHTDQGPPADANGNTISPQFNDDYSCNNGWVCEHRWIEVYNMIRFRNTVNGTEISEWWDNSNNQIAFSRGNAGFIAINADTIDLKQKIHTQLATGSYCDVISGNLVDGRCTGKTVQVDDQGFAFIKITVNDKDRVVAIHKNAKL